jgi:hypothetical protein
MTSQDKTGQDRTRQDKTRQDKAGQDKEGQDSDCLACHSTKSTNPAEDEQRNDHKLRLTYNLLQVRKACFSIDLQGIQAKQWRRGRERERRDTNGGK